MNKKVVNRRGGREKRRKIKRNKRGKKERIHKGLGRKYKHRQRILLP